MAEGSDAGEGGGAYGESLKPGERAPAPYAAGAVPSRGRRYGEPEWKKQIETLIDKRRPEIEAILRDYGVPLLDLEPAQASGKR